MADQHIQRRESPLIQRLRMHGVRVIASFELVHNGKTVRFDAHLPDFGGPAGMVLTLDGHGDADALEVAARAVCLAFAAIKDSAGLSESTLVSMMNIMGFSGSAAHLPAWYAGKTWAGLWDLGTGASDRDTPLGAAVRACEVHCMVDCCGMDAYEFAPEHLQPWADGVPAADLARAREQADEALAALTDAPDRFSFLESVYVRADVIAWFESIRDALAGVKPAP